ncbi:peptide-methionine (S)-S-oxide reductase MsrA [Patescibacteria group bacterium]|nr:peptide-methionine (S)-S-oxide reductase MsrA [Patescibacteria group bacterium]
MSDNRRTAVFGGGCFWCTEAVFKSLKGVISVTPGYTGGKTKAPTYEEVAAGGRTGHIEVVKIEYDPAIISYDDLLAVFFNIHDPTTIDRQGNDIGEQYSSAVFYADDEQKRKAEALIKELDEAHAYENKIVTAVRPLAEFFGAEDYHRDFYENHKDSPYCEIVIEPKLEKLRKRFAELVAPSAQAAPKAA